MVDARENRGVLTDVRDVTSLCSRPVRPGVLYQEEEASPAGSPRGQQH